jgi:beta-glucosidase-like glycosyl hydrolase
VSGVQGPASGKYLQVAYTCKHLVAYSQEAGRTHGSNAEVSDRDLVETYLPQVGR